MAKGELLGAIDCPMCGYGNGMRITEDKNGEPFGFCEANCDGQLRVGGKKSRVEQFYKHYPHIRRTGEAPPGNVAAAVPVASSGEGATETAAKPEQAQPIPPNRPSWRELMGVSNG